MCGNKYCDTCKMFMSGDHVCYMKTTTEEEATKLLKRKQKKKNNENEAVKKNGFSLTLNAHKTRRFNAMRAAYCVWKLQSIRLSYQSMPTRILSKEDVSLH